MHDDILVVCCRLQHNVARYRVHHVTSVAVWGFIYDLLDYTMIPHTHWTVFTGDMHIT